MKLFQEIVLHICVVSSFVWLIAKVLDWFNPFMNFGGQIQIFKIALCFGVIVLSLTKNLEKKSENE